VMDGLEATQRIRAQEPAGEHLPVMVMTANAKQGDRVSCLQAGMDDYFSKPIDRGELQRVLARYAPAPLKVDTQSDGSDVLPSVPPDHLDESALNFDYERALAASDQEVVDIVADVFMGQWPQNVEKMTQALTMGDMSPLLYTVHALKGTLGLFGAAPAVDSAAALEKLAAIGQSRLLESSVHREASMATELAALQTQVGYLLAALNARSRGSP